MTVKIKSQGKVLKKKGRGGVTYRAPTVIKHFQLKMELSLWPLSAEWFFPALNWCVS